MSNILISYPQVLFEAIYHNPTNTYLNHRPIDNLIAGEAHCYAELQAAATGTTRIQFDLGTSVTDTIDHVIVHRADLLIDQGVTTLLVEGGNGSSPAYSTVHNDASFASATLTGRFDTIYYETFATSTTYRWWRYSLTSASSVKRTQGKLHLGTLFDMDVDPDFQSNVITASARASVSVDGTEHIFKTDDGRYQVSLEWKGVTDAKAEQFISEIVPRKYVFLIESTDQGVLFGAEVMPCIIDQVEHTDQKDGFNTIRARFTEMLG